VSRNRMGKGGTSGASHGKEYASTADTGVVAIAAARPSLAIDSRVTDAVRGFD